MQRGQALAGQLDFVSVFAGPPIHAESDGILTVRFLAGVDDSGYAPIPRILPEVKPVADPEVADEIVVAPVQLIVSDL